MTYYLYSGEFPADEDRGDGKYCEKYDGFPVCDTTTGALYWPDFGSSYSGHRGKRFAQISSEEGLIKFEDEHGLVPTETLATILIWQSSYDLEDAERAVKAYEDHYNKPFEINYSKLAESLMQEANHQGDFVDITMEEHLADIKSKLIYFGIAPEGIHMRISIEVEAEHLEMTAFRPGSPLPKPKYGACNKG